MYFIQSTDGQTWAPRNKTTTPTPVRVTRMSGYGGTYYQKYALNAQGTRTAITTGQHRLASQIIRKPFSQVVTENSAADGTELIRFRMRDLGFDIGNMLYSRDPATGDPTSPIPCPWPGSGDLNADYLAEMTCRKQHCQDYIKYSIGFTDQTDSSGGNAVNWIIQDNNIHDAFQALNPWPTQTADQSRSQAKMEFNTYAAIQRGDKIVWRITADTQNMPPSLNWGFGAGVQYVNLNIHWENIQGSSYGSQSAFHDEWVIEGTDPTVPNLYAVERVRKHTNTIAMVVGPHTALRSINQQRDDAISNTLGYDVHSVTLPALGWQI